MEFYKKDIDKHNQKELDKLKNLKKQAKSSDISADDLVHEIDHFRKHLENLYPDINLKGPEEYPGDEDDYPEICYADGLITDFEDNAGNLLKQDSEQDSDDLKSTMESVENYFKAIKKLQKIDQESEFVYCPDYDSFDDLDDEPVKFYKLTTDNLVPIIDDLIKSVKSYLANDGGSCNLSIIYLKNIKKIKSLPEEIKKLNHYLLTTYLPKQKMVVHAGSYFLNHFNLIKYSSNITMNNHPEVIKNMLEKHKSTKYMMIRDIDSEGIGVSYLYKYSQLGFDNLLNLVIIDAQEF